MLLFSCKQEPKAIKEDNEIDLPKNPVAREEPMVLTTKSGKQFELIFHSNSDGLHDYHLIPKGFEFSKDTLIISDADPLSSAFLADLDDNGFEEIYLITTTDGSGSYGNIFGYASNADKSVSPIYLAPISEKDLSPGSYFEGYMGHDSIYLDQGKLMRKFPIYLEGDPNCCPSGGQTTLIYDLQAGEASWNLQATKQ